MIAPVLALAEAVTCEKLLFRAGPTATDSCASGAALYSELPDWLASITQLPTPMKLTVVPEMLQTPLAPPSIVNVTGLPEGPPVAAAT